MISGFNERNGVKPEASSARAVLTDTTSLPTIEYGGFAGRRHFGVGRHCLFLCLNWQPRLPFVARPQIVDDGETPHDEAIGIALSLCDRAMAQLQDRVTQVVQLRPRRFRHVGDSHIPRDDIRGEVGDLNTGRKFAVDEERLRHDAAGPHATTERLAEVSGHLIYEDVRLRAFNLVEYDQPTLRRYLLVHEIEEPLEQIRVVLSKGLGRRPRSSRRDNTGEDPHPVHCTKFKDRLCELDFACA